MNTKENVIYARKCEVESPLDPCHREYFEPSEYLLSEIMRMEKFASCNNAKLLLDKFSDKSNSLYEKIHFGNLMAVEGDPRIFNKDPIDMVDIPEGIVSIGIEESAVEEVVNEFKNVGVIADWIRKEVPIHQVEIKKFKISSYPVTNLEYLFYLLETPKGEVPTSWINGAFPLAYSNHPVYSISAHSADLYAKWYSSKENISFRLPTEYEWEYAAGGGVYKYPWGDQYEKGFANTVEENIISTTPVGSFPGCKLFKNLYDMAGNVEEYTNNDYFAYPGGDYIIDDLISDDRPTYRVTRGGCFGRFADLCRVTRRHGMSITPFASIYAVGFRLVSEIL